MARGPPDARCTIETDRGVSQKIRTVQPLRIYEVSSSSFGDPHPFEPEKKMIEDNMTHGDAEWSDLIVDMPLRTPSGLSKQEAVRTPGCCVKSRKRDPGRPPKYFGRVLKNEQDETIVLSHKGDDKFVWRGNQIQFEEHWACD